MEICYNIPTECNRRGVGHLNSKKKIPNATMKRLPLYYRFFKNAEKTSVDRVSSREISEALDIDSATIRRDFSYFGELGRKGYGYNVKSLLNFFMEHIQGNEVRNVAIIGAGNLGSALLNYKFSSINDRMNVVAAFDSNAQIVGTSINGTTVYHSDELEDLISRHSIDVAILTLPAEVSQDMAERLVEAGIKGILNFTPIRLNVSDEIYVHNIDLSVELQALFFYMKYI
ncbi:redox-sensing transcriptional repressor Rex [Salinicoccus cyprini]|uniref:Redox-sensing transcriptional repressor Rex n=1 Tax=Salinicoccus cyprini TaxID=2493691 RepID=A0A558AUC5_9STAP|nr:redox-sensing transcriptional repressor Rex [Salinicoccus cyprini]